MLGLTIEREFTVEIQEDKRIDLSWSRVLRGDIGESFGLVEQRVSTPFQA